jgi:hypothetical protein
MNDIAKKAISEKLRKACKDENLSREKASELLGLRSIYYAGMIASNNPKQWGNVSKQAWDQVRDWTNSGESIVKYSKKLAPAANVIADNSKKSADSAEAIEDAHDISEEQDQENVDWIKKMFGEIREADKNKPIDFKKMLAHLEINIVLKINGREVRI